MYWCVAPGNINFIQGPGVPLANSSLSVSLWFEKGYTNFTLPGGVILAAGQVGPSGGTTGKELQIAQDYNGAGLRFDFFNDSFDVPNVIGNGHWSHVVCTFDNVTMERRIYIDGNLIATNLAAFGFSGPTNFFQITPAANVPGGLIDNVRFYNRVLSGDEVTELYAFESACIPHRATATAQMTNGIVVGATITDGGCGYTNSPIVLIQGGGGTGATATAIVSNGEVVNIVITDAGSGYTSAPSIYIYSPLGLQIGLIKAVKPAFWELFIGTNYQLQVSTDLTNWINEGSVFPATNPTMVFPQYFDVDNWNSLFFRLQQSP